VSQLDLCGVWGSNLGVGVRAESGEKHVSRDFVLDNVHRQS
jgi:hypothetical protein